MSEIFDSFENALILLKVIAALLAVGIGAFVLKCVGSLLGPLAKAIRWLFGLPEGVAAGVAHGARLLIGSVIIAVSRWFCFA